MGSVYVISSLFSFYIRIACNGFDPILLWEMSAVHNVLEFKNERILPLDKEGEFRCALTSDGNDIRFFSILLIYRRNTVLLLYQSLCHHQIRVSRIGIKHLTEVTSSDRPEINPKLPINQYSFKRIEVEEGILYLYSTDGKVHSDSVTHLIALLRSTKPFSPLISLRFV